MANAGRMDQVNLVVRDMAASVAFYELLGFRFDEPPAQWAGHHRGSQGEGFQLELDSEEFARWWNRGWPGLGAGPGGAVLGLRFDTRAEVDAAHASVLEAGHASQQEPFDAFWGARFAVVQDPDGNAVAFQSLPEADRREAPPSLPFGER